MSYLKIPSLPEPTASSDIQPWVLEFLRLDTLVKAADELAITVRISGQQIREYWVILYQIFLLLRPYFSYPFKRTFLEMGKQIKELMQNYDDDLNAGIKEPSEELVYRLTRYHEWILIAKHKIGFGVPMSSSFKIKDKLKHALLGKG